MDKCTHSPQTVETFDATTADCYYGLARAATGKIVCCFAIKP